MTEPKTNGPDDEQIAAGARLLFDKTHPDLLPAPLQDRDKWFEETRDYWERATRELAAILGTPMTATCPCGYALNGPAPAVHQTMFFHKCEKTDPYWGKSTKDHYGIF